MENSLALVGLLCLGMALASEAALACNRATLFVFGDSYSDTGDGVLTRNPFNCRLVSPPYGTTYPGSPFRRFCDGRLRLDYLTTYMGLPFVDPSLNTTANFTAGVNYAVSAATALNISELRPYGIVAGTQFSLDWQLRRHLSLQASVESSNSGNPPLSSFGSGLYSIEIGFNDYNDALQLYEPSQVISTFVPLVIQKIRSVAETLYANGARNFLLTGVSAIGCTSSILATADQNSTKDENGCLVDYNLIASTHGSRLLAEVESLRTAYPLANFTFVDFYGAFIS